MDALKLYMTNETLLQTVRELTKEIHVKFGSEKCPKPSLERGLIILHSINKIMSYVNYTKTSNTNT